MTKLLFILLLSFGFSIDGEIDDKQRDILELVEVMHEPVDSLLSTVFEYIFMFGYEDINKSLVMDDLIKIMDSDEYYKIYVPFYDEKFTHSEIKDLLRFYNSDIGKKINNLSMEISLETTKKTQEYLKELIVEVKEVIGSNKEKYRIPKAEVEKIESQPDDRIEDIEIIDIEEEADEKKDYEFVAYDKAPWPKSGKSIFDFLVYPESAIPLKLSDKVFVKFYVDVDGRVRQNSIQMIRGNPIFEEAAFSAVAKSEWKPAMQRDMKVGVWMTVPVNFRYEDAKQGRDFVELKMTSEQITKAQELARECIKKNYKDCG